MLYFVVKSIPVTMIILINLPLALIGTSATKQILL